MTVANVSTVSSVQYMHAYDVSMCAVCKRRTYECSGKGVSGGCGEKTRREIKPQTGPDAHGNRTAGQGQAEGALPGFLSSGKHCLHAAPLRPEITECVSYPLVPGQGLLAGRELPTLGCRRPRHLQRCGLFPWHRGAEARGVWHSQPEKPSAPAAPCLWHSSENCAETGSRQEHVPRIQPPRATLVTLTPGACTLGTVTRALSEERAHTSGSAVIRSTHYWTQGPEKSKAPSHFPLAPSHLKESQDHSQVTAHRWLGLPCREGSF